MNLQDISSGEQSRGHLFLYLFQFQEVVYILWLTATSLHIQSQFSILLPSYEDPCDYTELPR